MGEGEQKVFAVSDLIASYNGDWLSKRIALWALSMHFATYLSV
jgi:hypothetical protein